MPEINPVLEEENHFIAVGPADAYTKPSPDPRITPNAMVNTEGELEKLDLTKPHDGAAPARINVHCNVAGGDS